MQLPVRADKIHRVTLEGRELDWQIAPGFGHALLSVQIPSASSVNS
jgi:hypothetical protein